MRWVALLLLLAGPAARADFIAEDFDLTRVLPPPPGDASPRTKQDLVAIHRWQVMRTGDMVKRARREAEDGLAAFRDPLGEGFVPAALPRTMALFAEVEAGATAAVRRAQAAYRRAGPAAVDTGIRVCDGTEPAGGLGVYPALGPDVLMLEALLLSRMVPERADAIVARARALATDRVMCGVHYPSDVEAGFMAASALAVVLDDNPRFRAGLGGAKGELRHALGLAEER